jgi:uncharacterized protein
MYLTQRLITFITVCWCLISTALAWQIDPAKLILAARNQVGVTVSYDPTYRKLNYPGGDVPLTTGVCSDVVIRSFRAQGVDLQKEVHEDMTKNFVKYPAAWGLSKPDANIDHRRVPNLMCFFKRQSWQLNITNQPADYLPGDVVAWNLGGAITHIGIVSDKKTLTGIPLVIHNIGNGTQEEDVLFKFKIIGHYRCTPKAVADKKIEPRQPALALY